MSKTAVLFCITLILFGILQSDAHRLRSHKASRRHRALPNDGALRFEPEPYSKKMELNSSGKIHCKVAGGVAPTVQWYLNEHDPLPQGLSSSNGTLLVSEASRDHRGKYTCRAKDGDTEITSTISLDVVVAPRVLEPPADQELHVSAGSDVWLHCRAAGDPAPMTHWDKNLTILSERPKDGVGVEEGKNSSTSRIVLMSNGTLAVRDVTPADSGRYGCTAGSAAGMDRRELTLIVHPEGELPPAESGGVAGKAVLVSISVAGAYMILVLALMVYCRRRRLQRRQRGEKMELEMAEGREMLVEDCVEEGKEKKPANGVLQANGRLLTHDKDSGADNSESCVSRASKKSGQYDHLSVPRTLLTEQITLGRGEFGEVLLAKIDMSRVRQVRQHREGGGAGGEGGEGQGELRPVLVKTLTTKDESQLCEFRRQLEMFSRVRHENVSRLIALCNETEPHCMLLAHTDWGDLKQFLLSTRTPEEQAEYTARVGEAAANRCGVATRACPPLQSTHRAALTAHLARAAAALAHRRLTHRDIAARNCLITSKLQLKLSLPALSRGPHSHEYYKLHDQVIPLRWLPSEAALEGDYSTKSDVYMFAATVWEIYTKAELPFGKLNDNSVLERLRAGTLEWTPPDAAPPRLAALLRKCWSKSPTDRPLFDYICEELNAIMQELTTENGSLDKVEADNKPCDDGVES